MKNLQHASAAMETGTVSVEINGQTLSGAYFASSRRLVVSSPLGAKTVYRGALPAQTLAVAVLKQLASRHDLATPLH